MLSELQNDMLNYVQSVRRRRLIKSINFSIALYHYDRSPHSHSCELLDSRCILFRWRQLFSFLRARDDVAVEDATSRLHPGTPHPPMRLRTGHKNSIAPPALASCFSSAYYYFYYYALICNWKIQEPTVAMRKIQLLLLHIIISTKYYYYYWVERRSRHVNPLSTSWALKVLCVPSDGTQCVELNINCGR